MSDWKEYSLGDISRNISRRFDFNAYPNVVFINTGDVLNNKFLHCEISNVKDLPGQAKKAIKKGDILYSEIRPGNGRYLFVDNDLDNYVVSTKFMVIEPNANIVLPEFLFLLLISNETTEYFKMIAESRSGTFPQITFDSVSSLSLNIPDKETQQKILDIITPLDDKIELNTQINQTLEQIAQALFKSWFVDFDPVRAKVQALSDGLSLEQAELAAMQTISGKTPEELTALSQTQPDRYAELAETAKAFPCEMVEVDGGEVPKGWEKTTLSEICEMQNGYAFKSFDWMEQGIPVIKIGSVKPIIVEVEGNGFVSEDYSKLKPDFLLTSSDILVGLTGYVGEVGRIPTGKIAMLNQRVAKFLPKEIDKNHCFYNYIYCLARQSQFKEFAEINAKGSAQANISTKELLKFPIIKANDKLHILFENRVKELLERILWNSQNAETLAKTRDLLLPRLLNGEV
ncbi:restriction endonuclease subunit S [Haemophilus influenzae]|uniref:restriction endonuclease subunit S n=1 Tax=Haemophilus influenzae TaxID=727 RepID=UPI000E57B693|nr:restriction endonuclease subunit S [Haemophilus influenzae]MCK9065304.1 restriction endonuclease subunit S [Haemophilus influenzae]